MNKRHTREQMLQLHDVTPISSSALLCKSYETLPQWQLPR